MARTVRTLVPLLFLAACRPAADVAPDGAAMDPLAQLEADTGHPWSVRWHRDVHTPAFMEGRTAPLAATPTDAERAGRAFVRKYRGLFQLEADEDDISPTQADTDELGMTHARFQQQKGKIPVWGGDLVAHFDASGALVRVNGRILPIAAMPPAAEVTADQARVTAANDARALRPDVDPARITTLEPVLWLYPIRVDQVKLAWRVEATVDDALAPLELEAFVDAADGTVLHHSDQAETVQASGVGVFGDRKPLAVATKRGGFWLEDTGRGDLKTYTAGGTSRLPGTEVHTRDAMSWDASGSAPGAAVDAHYYTGLAWDYFNDVHHRAGWDGKGTGPHVTVHFGAGFDNAFFNGRQLVFGDGDGDLMSPTAAALDVVAHEFTHGITAHTAKLGHEGEPGALNEGISDVFGCLVLQANGGDHSWQVGVTIYHPQGRPRPIRDVAHPHATGNPRALDEYQTTDQDQGGVHLNSTIASHAAYLMSEGGEGTTAIGPDDVGRIWYRALTRYLTSRAGFVDLADATLAAARDLGRGEQTVHDAWFAVGVVNE
jgi:Zn-dependent metalloprotease